MEQYTHTHTHTIQWDLHVCRVGEDCKIKKVADTVYDEKGNLVKIIKNL